MFRGFPNRAALLDVVGQALPIDDDRQQRLLGKFAGVARATIKGTLIIGGARA